MNRSVRLSWLALVALCCCVVIPPSGAIMETEIMELLEEFRARMCHPIPSLGLPALDPMQITQLDYKMDNKYVLDFTGSITDFRLTGLSDFVVNDLRITIIPTRTSSFNVTLPMTALKSLYTAKGSLYNIVNLAGDGDAEASAEEVTVALSWILRTGTTLGIRNLAIAITINNIHIDFENLFEEERLNSFFHALVNELGLELLDDVWQFERDSVTSVLESYIDGALGQISLSDIISIITSGGGGDGDGDLWGDVPADCKTTLIKQD